LKGWGAERTRKGDGVGAASGDEGDATAAARGEEERLREVVVLEPAVPELPVRARAPGPGPRLLPLHFRRRRRLHGPRVGSIFPCVAAQIAARIRRSIAERVLRISRGWVIVVSDP
jgi:hypothetical protein